MENQITRPARLAVAAVVALVGGVNAACPGSSSGPSRGSAAGSAAPAETPAAVVPRAEAGTDLSPRGVPFRIRVPEGVTIENLEPGVWIHREDPAFGVTVRPPSTGENGNYEEWREIYESNWGYTIVDARHDSDGFRLIVEREGQFEVIRYLRRQNHFCLNGDTSVYRSRQAIQPVVDACDSLTPVS